MTADWTATLEELQQLDEVGDGPLGYWGLSMGTMLGHPVRRRHARGPVRGARAHGHLHRPRSRGRPRHPTLTCPVLFLLQTDDELVPPDGGFALFRALGSPDKRLHAHPGLHSAVPLEEIDASESFLAHHLH